MRKEQIEIGGLYIAKVTGKEQTVKIVSVNPLGGFIAINQKTGRQIRIRTAARLRRPAAAEE